MDIKLIQRLAIKQVQQPVVFGEVLEESLKSI